MTDLSDADIEVLNAARTILKQRAKYNSADADYRVVTAALRAEDAEHAIFKALSAEHVYLGREMTDAQLHNRLASVPVPQSLRA
jgi:hypothetical protein